MVGGRFEESSKYLLSLLLETGGGSWLRAAGGTGSPVDAGNGADALTSVKVGKAETYQAAGFSPW